MHGRGHHNRGRISSQQSVISRGGGYNPVHVSHIPMSRQPTHNHSYMTPVVTTNIVKPGNQTQIHQRRPPAKVKHHRQVTTPSITTTLVQTHNHNRRPLPNVNSSHYQGDTYFSLGLAVPVISTHPSSSNYLPVSTSHSDTPIVSDVYPIEDLKSDTDTLLANSKIIDEDVYLAKQKIKLLSILFLATQDQPNTNWHKEQTEIIDAKDILTLQSKYRKITKQLIPTNVINNMKQTAQDHAGRAQKQNTLSTAFYSLFFLSIISCISFVCVVPILSLLTIIVSPPILTGIATAATVSAIMSIGTLLFATSTKNSAGRHRTQRSLLENLLCQFDQVLSTASLSIKSLGKMPKPFIQTAQPAETGLGNANAYAWEKEQQKIKSTMHSDSEEEEDEEDVYAGISFNPQTIKRSSQSYKTY